LQAIHPLGTSPVIKDAGGAHALVLAESGAIIADLAGGYGQGRLPPKADLASPQYVAYLHWLQFAEGSAMLPLLL
jgi:glutathione S-transferase